MTNGAGNLSQALRSITDRSFFGSVQWNSQQMRASQAGCHPHIIAFARKFVARMRRINVPIYAHNMLRTASEQNALYVQGVSQAIAGKSPHNFGMAVDIVSSIRHWDANDEIWQMLGHAGKELALQNGFKLVWGGDWRDPDGPGPATGWDPAHWEIANWKNLKGEFPWPTINPIPNQRP